MPTSDAATLTTAWTQVGAIGENVLIQNLTGFPIMWALAAVAPGVNFQGALLMNKDALRITLTEPLWMRAASDEAKYSKTVFV